MLQKLDAMLGRVLAFASICLFSTLFVVVFLQVFFRYFLNRPLVFTEELSQQIFVWICFFGWLMASRGQGHIAVNAVRTRLGAASRKLTDLTIELITIGVAIYLIHYGMLLMQRGMTVQAVSLPWPIAVVYVIIPVAAAASILLSLVRIVAILAPATESQP